MTKVALLILFNHRFDKNIPKLEELYKGKFSNIFFLVPFYDGERKDVIPVYGNSFYFGSYICQAYTHLKDKGFTHYYVVADDMIINPIINESNLLDVIGLEETDSFIPETFAIHTIPFYWSHAIQALQFKLQNPGLEIERILPSNDASLDKLKIFGYKEESIPLKTIMPFKSISHFIKWSIIHFRRKLLYPLIGGYSDTFIFTENNIKNFINYCGAFSSADLFVEVAIPTSLALSADNLKTEKDVKLKRGDMWGKEQVDAFSQKYNNNLSLLLKDFPNDILYFHPVKLSKWNFL